MSIPAGHPCGRPLTMLALLPAELRQEAHRSVRSCCVTFECLTARHAFVSRIEARCPDVIIVDTDLLGNVADLSRFARSLRPDVVLLAVTWYWSDRDEGLRAHVDAFLHKPPRRGAWQAVLDRTVQWWDAQRREDGPLRSATIR